MSRDQLGQLIGQRYRLVQTIGQGGMGQVFKAEDTLIGNRIVALKMLHQGMGGDEATQAQLRTRFLEEVKISGLLGGNPRIVAVYDYGVEKGQPYLVMEHLNGSSLADLIRNEGPLQPNRAVRLAMQVCAGLQYAHTFRTELDNNPIVGVIHRDIKPNNIFRMVEPAIGETIKILDFGIAKTVSEIATALGSQTNIMCTPAYASPEQLKGKKLDPRSDIYSLGVLIYEMLTGERPYIPETNSFPGWYEAHNYGHPREFRELNLRQEIPASLEAIVMACLDKDPARRPQSMQSLADQLAETLPELDALATKARLYEIEESYSQKLKEALTAKNFSQAYQVLDSMVVALPHLNAELRTRRKQIEHKQRQEELENRLQEATEAQEYSLAFTLIDSLLELVPDQAAALNKRRQQLEEQQKAQLETDFNRQLTEALSKQDLQKAIRITDQMLTVFPERTVELQDRIQSLQSTQEKLALEAKLNQQLNEALSIPDFQQAIQVLDQLTAAFPDQAQQYQNRRQELATVQRLVDLETDYNRQLQEAALARNYKRATEIIDLMLPVFPQRRLELEQYRQQLQKEQRLVLLEADYRRQLSEAMQSQQLTKALEVLDHIVEEFPQNEATLAPQRQHILDGIARQKTETEMNHRLAEAIQSLQYQQGIQIVDQMLSLFPERRAELTQQRQELVESLQKLVEELRQAHTTPVPRTLQPQVPSHPQPAPVSSDRPSDRPSNHSEAQTRRIGVTDASIVPTRDDSGESTRRIPTPPDVPTSVPQGLGAPQSAGTKTWLIPLIVGGVSVVGLGLFWVLRPQPLPVVQPSPTPLEPTPVALSSPIPATVPSPTALVPTATPVVIPVATPVPPLAPTPKPQSPTVPVAPQNPPPKPPFAQYNAQLQTAMSAGQWSRAISIVDRMMQDYPERRSELQRRRQELQSRLAPVPLAPIPTPKPVVKPTPKPAATATPRPRLTPLPITPATSKPVQDPQASCIETFVSTGASRSLATAQCDGRLDACLSAYQAAGLSADLALDQCKVDFR